MRMPVWLDVLFHLLFTLSYAIYYAKRHAWQKQYLIGSFLIFAFGVLIDLDHRRIIAKILKKLSRGRISFELPAHIIHICHTWEFALFVLAFSMVIFAAGLWDLAILIFLSYMTHMFIDAIGKPGPSPSNIFPAQINNFFRKIFS